MPEDYEYRFSPPQQSSRRTNIRITSHEEKWPTYLRIWQPPTDLYETADAYVVQVEVAGMIEGEFQVTLEERMVVVSGTRVVPNQAHAYYQMEIPSGEFITTLELPGPIVYEEVEADYADGFLKIVLPKAKPRKVDVRGEE
ncbi:MAG: Hsp20/alpha crystallin family protein [Anaerolineales bacterium]|nr:Hsp20/alpha crystallin family protein [Anaerolineales bacterium]